jgi:hypothetical protein
MAGALAARERERVAEEIRGLLGETLLKRLFAGLENGQFAAAVERVLKRQSHPRREAERLADAAAPTHERKADPQ